METPNSTRKAHLAGIQLGSLALMVAVAAVALAPILTPGIVLKALESIDKETSP